MTTSVTVSIPVFDEIVAVTKLTWYLVFQEIARD